MISVIFTYIKNMSKKTLKCFDFFATKSTDQKNYALKKPLKNACKNMRHTLIFG